MTHTPGPWTAKPSVHGNEYLYVQIGADESYTTLEMLSDDARLTAAAPDMLAALEMLNEIDGAYGIDLTEQQRDQLHDAIAKAQPANG